MDGKQDRCFVHFEINKGDLVLVKNHIFTYDGQEEEFLYGVVVGESKLDQISLFPEVKVYMFKSKTVRTFIAGSLEIISHAKRAP